MRTVGSPPLPRQSSLQRALSNLGTKSSKDSDDDASLSPRSNYYSSSSKKVLLPSKSSSSLQKELRKMKADSFLEQYEQLAQSRGKMRL